MPHHLGYAKHEHQGKTNQADLNDFLSDIPPDSQNTEPTSNLSFGQDETIMPEPKPPIKPKKGNNARNGTTSKTVRTDFSELQLDIPRDRTGNFVPEQGNSMDNAD